MLLSDSHCAENVLLSLFSLYNYEHIQVSDQHLFCLKRGATTITQITLRCVNNRGTTLPFPVLKHFETST